MKWTTTAQRGNQTLSLGQRKPRNPFATAASARNGGRHGTGAQRQRARLGLRHELDALRTQGP
ncbi:hypothetical protein [Rivibacter subsaxonicus]|uniref:Uncharacterized protein n=1 Tax=Rivibacter subsaxonicus TaxID=457575 RepID=A0A4Q7VZR2_9BURK|nr:hypothetical protein [Rivibacter subsaxonicus]RZU02005.1 hypothetical protein EV670_0023 [Rivibacter subsaxonicus]